VRRADHLLRGVLSSVSVSARDLEISKRGGLCPIRTLALQIKNKIRIEVTEIK